MITFAAGSELELAALRRNVRVVVALTSCLSGAALLIVFALGLVLPQLVEDDAGSNDADGIDTQQELQMRRRVASMLAAVVAIARSPSSAIGVVSELSADGPFTQTMLMVTMVTDVIVIVLFTAAVEFAEVLLSPDAAAADGAAAGAPLARVVGRFLGLSSLHLLLSFLHASALVALCLLALRLPAAPPALRPLALLAVGAFAFEAEHMLHAALHGSPLDDLVRLEPMLGCILCGFTLANLCGLTVRRTFADVLRRSMPPVLAFFFITTGMAVDLASLAHEWPAASGLFLARLLSIRAGYAVGISLAPPTAPAAVRSPTAWLALITQAGVGLGLAEEVGDRFAPWAEGLRTALVASIVLNQLVGPPLLKFALRASGEAGKSIGNTPRDRLVENLTRRLTKTNPIAVERIASAAAAIAAAVAPSAVPMPPTTPATAARAGVSSASSQGGGAAVEATAVGRAAAEEEDDELNGRGRSERFALSLLRVGFGAGGLLRGLIRRGRESRGDTRPID